MSSASLSSALAEIRALDQRELRNDLLLEYAARFEEVPARIATRPFASSSRVPACESEVYVWRERLEDGGLKFYFAVENPQGVSAKALAVFLDEHLSGMSVEEIRAVPDTIVFDLFGNNISMGKGQGLMSMIRMLRALAF